MTISPLSVGEPAPWFSGTIRRNGEAAGTFDELAGRHIILFFFGSAATPEMIEFLAEVGRDNNLLDGTRALFLGISNDPEDEKQGRLKDHYRGQLFFLDANGVVAKLYGLAEPTVTPVAFLLGPTMQIIEVVPWTESAAFHKRIMSSLSNRLANPPRAQNAPVLVVPQVFDRSFCRELVELYQSEGGREIGSIEKDGEIVERFDPNFRKRRDYYISDQQRIDQTKALLARRLLPMVFRAFQFQTTRVERYLIGCYDAQSGGYFRPHRDNTAAIVAHRRFAVTINLNEDYEGGHLRFPEFGDQVRCATPGDAIVFSCSLLHEVTPVTRGRRYAFLSFFYDERSQQLREQYAKMGAR
ncbi:peroxiredoxin [Bradyrhizobium sp. LB1.3]